MQHWICRHCGHTAFTYRHSTMSQRIFPAHLYYLHQIHQNPVMENWYKKNRFTLSAQGPDPGPGLQTVNIGQAHKSIVCRLDSQWTVLRRPDVIFVAPRVEGGVDINLDDAVSL